MPKIQNQVHLSEADRAYLNEVIEKGRVSAREIRRAHTLLLADERIRTLLPFCMSARKPCRAPGNAIAKSACRPR
jgi:hypothetical protein